MPRGPIFLVGSMGSGSTLLRLMLDAHPDIAIPQETGFLRLVLANKHVPFFAFGGQWYGRLGLTEEELEAELRAFYGGLFERYAASRGKRRWGEKTPFHVWHLELAARVFPDAQLVGIVRHPGAVAHSVHSRFHRSWDRSVQHWVRSVTQLLHEGMALGERFVLVRYEDLVAEPEPVLRALLDWLGEPWSPDVLAHHERPGAGSRWVDGHTRTDEPVDPTRAGRWAAALDGPTRALVRDRTGPLAAFLGYDVSGPRPPAAIGTGPIVTGAELSRRRGRHPGDVDWSFRPRPTPENRLLTPPPPWRPAAPAPARRGPAYRLARRLPLGLRLRFHALRRAARPTLAGFVSTLWTMTAQVGGELAARIGDLVRRPFCRQDEPGRRRPGREAAHRPDPPATGQEP